MYTVKQSTVGDTLGELANTNRGVTSAFRLCEVSQHSFIEYVDLDTLPSVCFPDGGQHPGAAALQARLRAYRGPPPVQQLKDYQVEAITNTVYRPAEVLVESKLYRGPQDEVRKLKCSITCDYSKLASDDLGDFTIVDLPTGSGKTIAAATAVVALADLRRADMEQWCARMLCPAPNPADKAGDAEARADYEHVRSSGPKYIQACSQYVDVAVVLCPTQLVAQWQHALAIALRVLGSQRQVLVNPSATELEHHRQHHHCDDTCGPPLVALYDNAARMPTGYLRFIPVLAVDEFVSLGQSYRVRQNGYNFVVSKDGARFFMVGRYVLVAADAGHVGGAAMGTPRGCLLRKWMRYNAIQDLFKCVQHTNTFTPQRWELAKLKQEAVHRLGAASVISSATRASIVRLMGLGEVPLYTHTVRFAPSLAGALLGTAFEARRANAVHHLRDTLDLDVSRCVTPQDVLAAVRKRSARAKGTVGATGTGATLLARLQQLESVLARFGEGSGGGGSATGGSAAEPATDTCAICCGDMQRGAPEGPPTLAMPCWHVFHRDCLRECVDRGLPCPLCRAGIDGALAHDGQAAPPAGEAGRSPFKRTLQETIPALLGPSPALFASVIAILQALHHHYCVAGNSSDVSAGGESCDGGRSASGGGSATAALGDADAAEDSAYRTLVVAPTGIDFQSLQQELEAQLPAGGALLTRFRTRGTRDDPVNAAAVCAQLQAFTAAAGPPFRVLFTSEGRADAMTGLDLPNVDAVVCVGAGNRVQRVGRLTRMGRRHRSAAAAVHCFELLPRGRTAATARARGFEATDDWVERVRAEQAAGGELDGVVNSFVPATHDADDTSTDADSERDDSDSDSESDADRSAGSAADRVSSGGGTGRGGKRRRREAMGDAREQSVCVRRRLIRRFGGGGPAQHAGIAGGSSAPAVPAVASGGDSSGGASASNGSGSASGVSSGHGGGSTGGGSTTDSTGASDRTGGTHAGALGTGAARNSDAAGTATNLALPWSVRAWLSSVKGLGAGALAVGVLDAIADALAAAGIYTRATAAQLDKEVLAQVLASCATGIVLRRMLADAAAALRLEQLPPPPSDTAQGGAAQAAGWMAAARSLDPDLTTEDSAELARALEQLLPPGGSSMALLAEVTPEDLGDVGVVKRGLKLLLLAPARAAAEAARAHGGGAAVAMAEGGRG